MTHTTTSGAADLRATFSEMLVDLPNTEPFTLFKAGFDAALAAGQAIAAPAQPAAQQGAAYAALPEPDATTVGLGAVWNRHSMRDFADATHTLRASHGQTSAGATEPTEQQILEAAFAPAQPVAEASRFGSPELQAMIIARCVEKDKAESAQEDAACWHWLAEYLVGTRTDLDDEIVASETVNDLRKLVEAAIKQGATP